MTGARYLIRRTWNGLEHFSKEAELSPRTLADVAARRAKVEQISIPVFMMPLRDIATLRQAREGK